MTTRDLRIGNYVGFKNRTDCYCEVVDLSYGGGIHIARIFGDGTEDDQPEVIEDITGLPLTEDWLKKFGFTQVDHATRLGPCPFYILQLRDDTSDILALRHYHKGGYLWGFTEDESVEERPSEIGSPKPIEFVHTLQNFWYFLTGQELTIKNQ